MQAGRLHPERHGHYGPPAALGLAARFGVTWERAILLLKPSNRPRYSGGGSKRPPSTILRIVSWGMVPRSRIALLLIFWVPNPGRFSPGFAEVCSPGFTSISRPGPAGADLGFLYFSANCSSCSRDKPVASSRSLADLSSLRASLRLRSTKSLCG